MEGPQNIAGEQDMPVKHSMPTEPREKMWAELSDAEKIERMHGIVWNLQETLRDLRREVAQLERHEHGHAGGVLISLNTYGSYDVSPRVDKDRWF